MFAIYYIIALCCLSPGNPGGKLGYRPVQYAINGRIGASDQLAPLKQNRVFFLVPLRFLFVGSISRFFIGTNVNIFHIYTTFAGSSTSPLNNFFVVTLIFPIGVFLLEIFQPNLVSPRLIKRALKVVELFGCGVRPLAGYFCLFREDMHFCSLIFGALTPYLEN